MNTYSINTLNTFTTTQLKDMLDTKAMQAIYLNKVLKKYSNSHTAKRLITTQLNNIKAFISAAQEMVYLKQDNINNDNQYSNIKKIYKLV
jgi:hypothetical protein